MSDARLRRIYLSALEHAAAGEGPREEYLPTEEPTVMVDGLEVKFHLDNSNAIYYEVGDIDDLVYVSGTENKTPVVSKQEFVQRVKEIVEDQLERYE